MVYALLDLVLDMSELVNLRNEVSGVSMTVTAKEAQRILSHPVIGKYQKVVRTDKPEVLGEDSRTKADLLDEIRQRNYYRSDEDQIPTYGTKAELLDALAEDDLKGTD